MLLGCGSMLKHSFIILAYKESDDLEECIKSVLNQSVKSNVLITTSTPNDFIMELASNYSLGVMVNDTRSNKGNDFNFALATMNSELITIAHQDDLYNRNYTKEILETYKKNKDATIIFTDNYEIRKDKKINHSRELSRKRYYLYPLKFRFFQNKKYFKLRALKKEKFICTSSITFVKKNIDDNLFPTDLIYDNDWKALINLAKENKRFVYIDDKLVGYRVNKKNISKGKIKEDDDIIRSLYSDFIAEKVIEKRNRKREKKSKKIL